ncbi:MAG TPA: NRDE family protein, partial [Geobacteraceae bacterium]
MWYRAAPYFTPTRESCNASAAFPVSRQSIAWYPSSMCLILIAYDCHPHYRLIVAANRDEYHVRPTAPAAFWEETPQLLAGRDLQGGGTWLGMTTTGRFAALTNFREPHRHHPSAPSRGRLVSDFLQGDADIATF